ncbi:unnamed protein product, partial [Symbiodinium sp. CCMP2592]
TWLRRLEGQDGHSVFGGFTGGFRSGRPGTGWNSSRVPQMKVGGDVRVNTVISSGSHLGNVSAVRAFLFLFFGIVGGLEVWRCHSHERCF